MTHAHLRPAMKRILLCLPLCLALPVCAGQAPWVSLFNGKDYTGWKLVGPANLAPAEIADGAMVLRQRVKTAEHTFVVSELAYRDFILELDLKSDPGFNSGILLRCVDAPESARVRLNGYQVKIDNTARAWTGGIFDDFGDAWRWLHDLADNEPGRTAFKPGEWAHFRIEAIGDTIKVWVNGVPTCHLVDAKYRAGRIAFKIHSLGDRPDDTRNAIRLKNIRIVTEQPERFAQPMTLPPQRAPATPGKFDRPKRPRRRKAGRSERANHRGSLPEGPRSGTYTRRHKSGSMGARCPHRAGWRGGSENPRGEGTPPPSHGSF
jgi:hypothetical protein